MIQTIKKISFLGLCLHTKRAHCSRPSIFTACLSSILICRRTQLWHASSQSKITFLSNMQDWLLQNMQLIQYPHVSSFSTVITNEFIGEDFYLKKHSMDGYEAMRFEVTQLTQDMEQSLFTIHTNIPIPVLVDGDAFQWAKYGHHILPSNLDLTSHKNTGIHQTFWNSLIEFLRTYLDGNLLPSNLDLTSHNKADLRQTFQKSLVEFLCKDFLIEFLR
jgi:hypothetical protein